jgi:hypothetical protein
VTVRASRADRFVEAPAALRSLTRERTASSASLVVPLGGARAAKDAYASHASGTIATCGLGVRGPAGLRTSDGPLSGVRPDAGESLGTPGWSTIAPAQWLRDADAFQRLRRPAKPM